MKNSHYNREHFKNELSNVKNEFRDAYESALGVRPVFSLDHLTVLELQARTFNLRRAQATNRFA